MPRGRCKLVHDLIKDLSDSEGTVGEVYESLGYGKFEIIEHSNSTSVRIRFLKTGYESVVSYYAAKHGKVRDNLAPTIFGVGFTGGEPTTIGDGKLLSIYNTWRSMLDRCYNEKLWLKKPTYKGCKVSEEFHNFSYFKNWCEKQIGYGNKGWHLDKDILVKGNKIYSEDTCCFVPREINSLLCYSQASKGHLPVGVRWDDKARKFAAQMSKNGRRKFLGYFNSEGEAFHAYKIAKECHIKSLAGVYKDRIDPKVYNALMNWVIEIED